MAAKKSSKTRKAKPRRSVVKTSPAKQAQTIAELRQQLTESLKREKAALNDVQVRDQQLAESLQRENATSDVLRLIAGSAKNLQQVLSAVAENAARLIGAQDAIIHQIDGDVLRDAAHYGLIPRLLSTDSSFTSTTFSQSRSENFDSPSRALSVTVRGLCSAYHFSVKVFPSELFSFDVLKFGLSRTRKSNFSRHSPINQ